MKHLFILYHFNVNIAKKHYAKYQNPSREKATSNIFDQD